MKPFEDFRPYAWLIVVIGLALAGLGAVLPHYEAGYHLHGTLFVALALPFLAYASLTESLRPGWLAAAGVLILAATLVLALRLRALATAQAAGFLELALPLVVAVVLLGIAGLMGRRES